MNVDVEKLLKERYYLKNENSWNDIATRVSVIYPPVYPLLRDMKFIPSSPTLQNTNTNGERRGTKSSCFTLDITDDIEGIFESLKECALVTKLGGGVGYVFSNLRSSYEGISSLGDRPSSGPIPFMNIFNATLDGVSQGGVRRGAGMAQFDIYHPNVLELIRLKENEGVLERFNISIRIDGNFYERLKENPDSPHIVITKNGNCFPLYENGKVVTTKMLWDIIIYNAWKSAEPGIFHVDIAERQCTVTHISSEVLSNPCQPKWAKIITPNGIREFNDIDVGSTIWSNEGWTKVVNKWSTGIKSIYKYETTAGIFYGTENHKIVQEGEKIEVKDADTIDIIKGPHYIFNEFENLNPQDIMDGLIIGDGSVHQASNNKIYLCIGENDQEYFDSEIKDLILKQNGISNPYSYDINTTITAEELPKTFERRVPERFIKGDIKKVKGFLRGLYSANGSVCGNRITLKTTSKQLVEDVQLMLNSISIKSYYTTNKSKEISFSNGNYISKESYDLNITADRNAFIRMIGFIQNYKNEKITLNKSTRYKKSYEIINIEYLGEEEVFDITVDNKSHTYWTQGCNVSNCAEYVNIANSSCNLGSINLLMYVLEDGTFDWDSFTKDVGIATRFLNAVIDDNEYPLQKIEDTTKAIRPIGLGMMALGHALYKMRIPYHSERAHDFIERVSYNLTMISMLESIEIAKVDSPYPAWNLENFLNANERFFSKLDEYNKSFILNELINNGVRNSCFTSIAPNGSISFIAGKLSGGIEPVFALAYIRKIEKENKTYDTVYIVDSIFEEYLNDNYDEDTKNKILNYVSLNNGSCQGCEYMPDEDQEIFVTAGDLSPIEHLEVLGIVARNTSLSVSKTINMPKTTTPEEISEVYLKAHELGIIGVTVYRDGCRRGILTTSDEHYKFEKHNAPKRPKSLNADYTIVKVHGIEYAIITGLYKEKPYEVFAIVNPVIKRNLVGKVIKISKGVYKFVSEDYEIENIANTTPNEKVITVLASMLLRHGADIRYVIHQCKKMSNGLNDFMSAISRVLKRYIPDGENSIELCPNCNFRLVHENGCVSCHSCGWSGCS